MRVGSGRRMRSRRRVGRLPPTMSRRTFEVLDGLVVVVIANATTTLSGVLIPPWRHRAQEIGAKLRLKRKTIAASTRGPKFDPGCAIATLRSEPERSSERVYLEAGAG